MFLRKEIDQQLNNCNKVHQLIKTQESIKEETLDQQLREIINKVAMTIIKSRNNYNKPNLRNLHFMIYKFIVSDSLKPKIMNNHLILTLN